MMNRGARILISLPMEWIEDVPDWNSIRKCITSIHYMSFDLSGWNSIPDQAGHFALSLTHLHSHQSIKPSVRAVCVCVCVCVCEYMQVEQYTHKKLKAYNITLRSMTTDN